MDFVDVTIKSILASERGNGELTKVYINEHKGQFPVYTGQIGKPMGYIDTATEHEPSISYVTDGCAGVISYISDSDYTIGGHRAKIKILNDNLDLKYIMYVLQPVLLEAKKDGNVPSVIWKDVENKTIPIPVKDGVYDLDAQKLLAGRYQMIEEKKSQIQDEVDEILATIPNIKLDGMVDVQIDKILDFDQATNNSKFTKRFIKQNKGQIPVYGASKETDVPSYGYVADNIENVKYFNDCLTYNIDGLAGRMFYRKGKFSTSEKVLPLPVFEEIASTIDLTYIKYVAEPLFMAKRKGRIGDNGVNEYTKLHKSEARVIKIPMPIKDGKYDLDRQIEIAKRYERIDKLKAELQEKVDNIINTSVIID